MHTVGDGPSVEGCPPKDGANDGHPILPANRIDGPSAEDVYVILGMPGLLAAVAAPALRSVAAIQWAIPVTPAPERQASAKDYDTGR